MHYYAHFIIFCLFLQLLFCLFLLFLLGSCCCINNVLFCAICIYIHPTHSLFCNYSLVFHIVFIFCSHSFATIKVQKTRTLDEFFHNSPGALCGAWALLIFGISSSKLIIYLYNSHKKARNFSEFISFIFPCFYSLFHVLNLFI